MTTCLVSMLVASVSALLGCTAMDHDSQVGLGAGAVERRTSASQCVPRSTGAAGLPAAWQAYAPFIDTCTLIAPNGTSALTLVSVSAKRYYANRAPGAEAVELPRALIVGATGRVTGELPFAYPDDPPRALELSFADWRGGRPWRIDMLVRDPTVSGDHSLPPLLWDPIASQYVASPVR